VKEKNTSSKSTMKNQFSKYSKGSSKNPIIRQTGNPDTKNFNSENQDMTNKELVKQLEGEKILAEISSEFIRVANSDIDEHISIALKRMSEYLEADLGVIRFIDTENNRIQRGYEWINPQLHNLKSKMPGYTFDDFLLMKQQLINNIPIYVPEVIEIPEEAKKEREYLKRIGFESVVLLPFFLTGKFTGYIGFGARKRHSFWSEREKGLLELFRSIIVNVLERHDRETVLRESQQLYQKLVELSPSNIFLLQDRKIIFANPAGVALIGFETQQDVIGKSFKDVVPEEILQKIRNRIDKFPIDQKLLGLELPFTTKRNKKVILQCAIQSLVLQGKKSFLVIGVDITQRKEIEQENEENRQLLDDILNISPQAIFVYDHHEEKPTYFNNSTCKILGLTSEEIRNMNDKDFINFVHPEDLEKAIRINMELSDVPVGEIVEGEYRWKRPDGQVCWLQSYQTAIKKSKNGKTSQTLTVVQDITEIKNALMELKKSEANFRGLVENIPGMVYQAMLEEPFSNTYLSEYFEKLTGYRCEDFIENGLDSWLKLVNPEDLPKLQNDINLFKDSFSKPFEAEYRIRKANGDYIWVVDIGRVQLDENQKPIALNGLVMDITARKNDYEAMRALSQDNLHLLAQARRDSEIKTLLLNEVNHRVKNNLTAIIGLLELESDHVINSSKDYRAVLGDIIARINSMATVHDILTSNQWSPVQLELFVQKIIDNASASSPIGRKISVEIMSQDRNLWINSRQATGLALILNELTTNAIKHAFVDRNRGKITVTIRREEKNTNRVRIRFADDGPGWPENILDETGGDIGIQVIRLSVASPLNGDVKFENHNGAVAIISFNLASQRDTVKPNGIKQ
jgi:PAS domain S-box-containing protein